MRSLLSLTSGQERLNEIASFAKDYAQCNGICVRLDDQSDRSDVARIQAFTLAPSPVPVKLYNQACRLQKNFGQLYHKIAYDYNFMKMNLSRIVEHDDFTRQLFNIYEEVYFKSKPVQNTSVTIQRADYMFHRNQQTTTTTDGCDGDHLTDVDAACRFNENLIEKNFTCQPTIQTWADNLTLKQVEVNTMASGAAAVSCQVAKMHDQVLKRFNDVVIQPKMSGRLAINNALDNVSRGLLSAWKYYGNDQAFVLFVIEGLDLNAMDQRMTEFALFNASDYKAKVLRLTLKQCDEQLYLDESCGRKLKTKFENREISVVYFRSGYVPSQYPSEAEWRARRLIELSRAIKCPWIGAHLAGCKKIQQVITDRQQLIQFVDDPETVDHMTSTFAKIYSLDADHPGTQDAIEAAQAHPERFVLKPQREGGGHNLFDNALAKRLETSNAVDLETCVLMERLRPMVHYNVLVRPNQPLKMCAVDSELGTFGYLLGNSDNAILEQAQFGHLFRTKPNIDNEGGTIKGTAGHDTPYLVVDN